MHIRAKGSKHICRLHLEAPRETRGSAIGLYLCSRMSVHTNRLCSLDFTMIRWQQRENKSSWHCHVGHPTGLSGHPGCSEESAPCPCQRSLAWRPGCSESTALSHVPHFPPFSPPSLPAFLHRNKCSLQPSHSFSEHSQRV